MDTPEFGDEPGLSAETKREVWGRACEILFGNCGLSLRGTSKTSNGKTLLLVRWPEGMAQVVEGLDTEERNGSDA